MSSSSLSTDFHRQILSFGSFTSPSSIQSFTDPWLGIQTQLAPLPQGLLRILIIYVPIYLIPELISRLKTSLSQEGEEKTFFEYLEEIRTLYCNPTTFLSAIRSTKTYFSIEKTRLAALNHVVFTRKQATKMRRRWECHVGRLQVPLTRPWDTFLLGRSRIVIEDVASELTSQRSYRARHGARTFHQAPRHYDQETRKELARYVLLSEASRQETQAESTISSTIRFALKG